MEQCNSDCGTVEQYCWKSVVEQCNCDGGTVLVEQCGETVRQWNSAG